MPNVDINIWAVLAATVVSMIIGSVWYSPKLFGNQWMALVGITEDIAKKSANRAIVGMMACSFITMYVMAHIVDYATADTLKEGIQTGMWLWLGFVGAVSLSDVFFAHRPFKLWMITAGYELVNFLIGASILALWK